jgi:hypothetical protein
VQNISSAQDADDADENPKAIEGDVGAIALEGGAPCQHHGVNGVENPDEHERTVRPEPAHEAEAENPHQNTGHFHDFNVAKNE